MFSYTYIVKPLHVFCILTYTCFMYTQIYIHETYHPQICYCVVTHIILCFLMLPPSKTLFVLPKQPNVCNGPPSTAFGLSSNCILFLGGCHPKTAMFLSSLHLDFYPNFLVLGQHPLPLDSFLGGCHPKTAMFQSSFHLDCYPNFLVLGQHPLPLASFLGSCHPKTAMFHCSFHLDCYPNFLVLGQHSLPLVSFLGSCHPKTAMFQSSLHLDCYPNFLVLGQHPLPLDDHPHSLSQVYYLTCSTEHQCLD
ncbi:unnamed protein product [Meganyctiphanes norvegica]|uniref:Uncharacterized protein n=1 Tax=Meganyctiphanes norvegica TaxID=48144 RepID=A0AAV2Q2A5_MEGNR